jgi:hypothetical protein
MVLFLTIEKNWLKKKPRDEIIAKWDKLWNDLEENWETMGSGNEGGAKVTVAGLEDVAKILGFNVSCSKIAEAFESHDKRLKGCLECPDGLPKPLQ